MDMATTNSGRSNNGCWTCRLRKKKCDETRPTCLTCNCLGLDCSAYGPRPPWMDRGPLEKEQARIIKNVINQTRSRARKRPSSWQDAGVGAANRPPSSHGADLATLNRGMATHVDGFGFGAYEQNPASLRYPMWSDAGYHMPPYGQANSTTIPPAGLNDGQTVSDSASPVASDSAMSAYLSTPALSAMTRPNTWTDYDSNSNGSSQRRQLPEVSNEFSLTDSLPLLNTSTSWPAVTGLNQMHASNPSALTSTSFKDGVDLYKSGDVVTRDNSSFTLGGANPDVFSGSTHEQEPRESRYAEDALLMCYLDRVFYAQYPFFDSSGSEGRGWLLSTLRRFESVYYATLALCGCYQSQAIACCRSPTRMSDNFGLHDRYYNRALHEMQLSLAQSRTQPTGATGLAQSIETVVCSLQFLFIEIFRGGRENWQVHLSAAATSAQALFDTQKSWLAPTLVSSESSRHTPTKQNVSAHPGEESAIRFVLCAVLSIDVISCASLRSRHFVSLDHGEVLEQADIRVETLTGYPVWVLHAIHKVSRLDEWKRQAERTQQLSVAELAKRGNTIKASIDSRLEAMADGTAQISPPTGDAADPDSGSHHFRSTGSSGSGVYDNITRAFALAATTYLHVVISGAFPDLPEIRESVSRTLTAFQSLPDVQTLRHMVWPFCVSACLATEAQYATWRALAAAVESEGDANDSRGGGTHKEKDVGTLSEAVRIVEECWSARKEYQTGAGRAGSCDWVTAMKRKGYHVLLW